MSVGAVLGTIASILLSYGFDGLVDRIQRNSKTMTNDEIIKMVSKNISKLRSKNQTKYDQLVRDISALNPNSSSELVNRLITTVRNSKLSEAKSVEKKITENTNEADNLSNRLTMWASSPTSYQVSKQGVKDIQDIALDAGSGWQDSKKIDTKGIVHKIENLL